MTMAYFENPIDWHDTVKNAVYHHVHTRHPDIEKDDLFIDFFSSEDGYIRAMVGVDPDRNLERAYYEVTISPEPHDSIRVDINVYQLTKGYIQFFDNFGAGALN